MDKILVSLEAKLVPESETDYFKADVDSLLCGYNDPSAKVNNPNIERFYYQNKIVATSVSLNKSQMGDDLYNSELEYWLCHGYLIDIEHDDYTILKKETRYCMTKETLDIVNDLFAEDKQKYESRIYQLEREKKATGQSFDEFAEMIDTAGFFKRLKYLFTGKIK